MADYFIGDTHFGCEALLSIRTAFRSTQEMDNFILDNWESRVTNNDHVYILGDLFDRPSKSRILLPANARSEIPDSWKP